MTTATPTAEKQYVFFRKNEGDEPKCPPSRLTEREARIFISVSFKDVERAIRKLKRGGEVRTRYASYSAREIE